MPELLFVCVINRKNGNFLPGDVDKFHSVDYQAKKIIIERKEKHSYHFECMKIPFVHLHRAEYKLDFVFQWKLPTPNELNCKQMVLVEY